MTLPWQINPALSKPQETPLQSWDRSQRGRRLGKLAVKLQNAQLTPIQREQYRTLAAERRALVRMSTTTGQTDCENVLRFPGGAK